MKQKLRAFTVRAMVPVDATDEELADFIRELEWAGGCRHPDDPFFESIKIERITIRKKAYVDGPST